MKESLPLSWLRPLDSCGALACARKSDSFTFSSCWCLGVHMEPVMEDSEGMTDDAKLEHIMAVLRATPGCTGAAPSSYTGPDLATRWMCMCESMEG